MTPLPPGAAQASEVEGTLRPRSPSPALITLLEAAEDAACSFDADARPQLSPLVASALEEAAAAPPTPAAPDAPGRVDDLAAVVASLGWDPACADFSRPLDARDLIHRLKAACLSDLHLVGEGSYSMVFRARDALHGTQVTLKKLRMDASADGLAATAVREISLLRELAGCPHVVRLLDVLYDRSRLDAHPRVWLVLEHLDMDLSEHIKRAPAPGLDPAFVRSAARQLLLGLEAVHAHRVIHRDVKPQNILVDRASGRIKLADFGLSRAWVPGGGGAAAAADVRALTQEVVTLLYRAPEILLGCADYTAAIDMWSAGCVLAEMVLGAPLFRGDSEIGQLYDIFRLLGTPDEATWPGVTSLPDWQPLFPRWRPQPLDAMLGPGRLCPAGLDLMAALLHPDPRRRPSAAQALLHPYFAPLRHHTDETRPT